MVKVSLIVRVVLIIILLYIIGQALFNWYLSIQTPLIEKFKEIYDSLRNTKQYD